MKKEIYLRKVIEKEALSLGPVQMSLRNNTALTAAAVRKLDGMLAAAKGRALSEEEARRLQREKCAHA